MVVSGDPMVDTCVSRTPSKSIKIDWIVPKWIWKRGAVQRCRIAEIQWNRTKFRGIWLTSQVAPRPRWLVHHGIVCLIHSFNKQTRSITQILKLPNEWIFITPTPQGQWKPIIRSNKRPSVAIQFSIWNSSTFQRICIGRHGQRNESSFITG